MSDIRLSDCTIFSTPILNKLLRLASLTYLKLAGWRIEGVSPKAERFVMIAAPHTSNWDLPMTLVVVFALRLKVYYLAKHTLFRPPFGLFLRWLGGIPVDRTKSNNLVEQIVDLYNSHDQLIIIVPPEGTRKKVRYWKSGFYHMAHGAKVPIALGFIDFKRKVAGLGGMLSPSGDFEADLPVIQAFYSGIVGKNPDN
ncbi:MAG: lysophospholipid acyltransferase family protein [Geobacteraceae bacterium]|nr:lysophospholipid acyltransferase family protein [Geobacteraceae bacterium]